MSGFTTHTRQTSSADSVSVENTTLRPINAASPRKMTSLIDLKRRIPATPKSRQFSRHRYAEDEENTPVALQNISHSRKTTNSSSSEQDSRLNIAAARAWEKITGSHIAPTSTTPVQAYLRLRPPNKSTTSVGEFVPNVKILSSCSVAMLATPNSSQATHTMPRATSMMSVPLAKSSSVYANDSTTYQFSGVFETTTSQQEVFETTTLPLVRGLLGLNSAGKMENALIFAYGVSGGGKTHTIQGVEDTDPGILPRALETIMKSVHNKHTASHMRPCLLNSLEMPPVYERSASNQILQSGRESLQSSADTTLANAYALSLPEEFQYSVWISYAEVYNEKIYDLLAPNERRKALPLKTDRQSGHKYIQGLSEIRVWSAEDAYGTLKSGQVNRQVFTTQLNEMSSRSHSIFTIKVLRLPRNVAPDDMTAVGHAARITIVDLAGSERHKNAQTVGDRLKEAANINKSLMVLGQCLEVMRRNAEDRQRHKKAAIVPFRHSKLTEIFQSFFLGDGVAIMIAAVNPFQTSYDENAQVMRFAAQAQKVLTVLSSGHNPISKPPESSKVPHYATPLQIRTKANSVPHWPSAVEPHISENCLHNKNRPNLSRPCNDSSPKNECPDYTSEEDEDVDDSENEDAFVSHLLDEIRALRRRIVELETEKEVEIAAAIQSAFDASARQLEEVEARHSARLKEQAERAAWKMDQKLDILMRSHEAHIRQLLGTDFPTPEANQSQEESFTDMHNANA